MFKLVEELFMVAVVEAPLALLEEVVKVVRFDAVESAQAS